MPKSDLRKIIRKNRSFYLLPVVIFLLFLVIFWLVIKPRLEEISSFRTEIREEEKKLSQLTDKIAFLERADLTELSEMSARAAQALPAETKFPLLLMVLENLAKESEVEIEEITIKPAREAVKNDAAPVGLSDFVFSFTLDGSQEQTREFLTQIHSVLPLMAVKKFTSESQAAAGNVASEIEAASYFLILPKTLGLAEKPLEAISKAEESVSQKLSQYEELVKEGSMITIPTGKENPFSF